MYPNPQDALPFPERPNLSQYKKLAKDLLKCFDSGGETTAVPAWASRWLEALAELQQFRDEPCGTPQRSSLMQADLPGSRWRGTKPATSSPSVTHSS